MRILTAALMLAIPLAAQDFNAAFFKADPKAAMLACVEKARSIDSKDSRLLAEYGRVYLAAGDRKRAEEAFEAGIKADLHDAETHYLVAYAWLKMGFRAEALLAFDQMTAMDPKGKNSFTKAALLLLDAGEEAKASEIMEKAWNLDRKDWYNTSEFARAAVRNGKTDLAALWFERTVQAQPKSKRVWNEIALALADKGQPVRRAL